MTTPPLLPPPDDTIRPRGMPDAEAGSSSCRDLSPDPAHEGDGSRQLGRAGGGGPTGRQMAGQRMAGWRMAGGQVAGRQPAGWNLGSGRRRWRGRQVTGTVVALALLVGACATGGDEAEEAPEPRPVTVAESELLAGVRFRNFDAGSRAVTAVYTDRGHAVELKGWFDYTTHTGFGLVSVDDEPTDRVTWNGKVVATTDGEQLGRPLKSLDGWQAGKLDPTSSPLAVVLTVLASLGVDRPENPLLIRQGGALWLREDTTADRPVTVFAGPTSTPEEPAPDGEGAGRGKDAENRAASRGGDKAADAGGSPDPGASPDAAAPPAAESPAPGGDGQETAIDPEAAGMRYWVDANGLAHRVDVRLGEHWAEITLENDGVKVPALLQNVMLPGGKQKQQKSDD